MRIQLSWNRVKMRARFGRSVLGIVLLAMILFVSELAAMDINVHPDRNPVRLNESFSLTFTAHNSPSGDPDFSALKQDFEVLNQSQSSNISLLNGNYSKSVTWTLTMMAKKTGRLRIPAISFGQDHSDSIYLNVLGATNDGLKDDSELLIEVSAQPENPYVQAQVVYTVRFLRRVDITQASLSEPVVGNAMIQKLGDDRSFSVWRKGYQYAVTERKYALFPQQSGFVTIPPLVLKADVVTSGRRGFFNRRNTQIRRIQSQAVALDVRPVPAEFKGDYWFPAEQVVLQEHWSNNPPSATVGEPLTRTLSLTATGAPLNLLPELGKLRFKGTAAKLLKQYPDQPALNEQKSFSGIVSSREQKIALIPVSPGSFRSEPLEIPWWNTQMNRMEVARLPAITIKAFPAVASTAKNPVAVGILNRENRETSAPNSSEPILAGSSRVERGNRFWLWVSVALAIGWGSTLIYLAKKNLAPKSRRISKEPQPTATERRSVRTLKQACRDNNPLEAKDALLTWGVLHWPQSPPRNLATLASMCDAKLGGEINSLSQSLYGRDGRDWSGNGCWEAFSSYVDRAVKKDKNQTVDLQPLFKA